MSKNRNRLKELRLEHGYTLDDVESKTGIKRGTYSNYENYKTEPKLETLLDLADFYDVSMSYLQGYTYSKKDVFKLISRVCATNATPTYQYLVSDINHHLKIIGFSKITELFTNQELETFTSSVKLFFQANFQFVFLTRIGRSMLIREKGDKSSKTLFDIQFAFSSAISDVDRELTSTPINDAFNKEVGGAWSNFMHDRNYLLRYGNKNEIINEINELKQALTSFSDKLSELPENQNILTPEKAKKKLQNFINSGGKSFE